MFGCPTSHPARVALPGAGPFALLSHHRLFPGLHGRGHLGQWLLFRRGLRPSMKSGEPRPAADALRAVFGELFSRTPDARPIVGCDVRHGRIPQA
jgi:hypothetical protein